MGACARGVADITTLPFTVIKTRFEVNTAMHNCLYCTVYLLVPANVAW